MEIVTKILPIALAFIMLTLGLSLTTQDFIRVIKQPKDFLLGMFSQILILPFVAILLIKVWPISPELAVGLLIILTFSLIVSSMYVVEIYSRLKGGSCLINIYLHFTRSNFCFFKIL